MKFVMLGAAAVFAGVLGCGSGAGANAGDSGRQDTSLDALRDVSGDSRSEEGRGGSDTGSGHAPYPAPHPPVPRAFDFGGPVLTAPTLVPIFFADDPLEGQIVTFLTALAGSSFWPAAVTEYGVGPLTIAPSIVVTDDPPTSTTDAEIQAWLASYLNGTHAAWPPAALGNIYMVFYPSVTSITVPDDGTSCVDFGGYHYEGMVMRVAPTPEGGVPEGGVDGGPGDGSADGGTTPFTYAVIPRCGMFAGYSGIDTVTLAVSHETVESSTDPLTRTKVAYGGVDRDHMVWQLDPGGEVADLCAYEPQSYQRLVGDFLVQRVWSNVEAEKGHDPCVPPVPVTPSPVYFNAAPDLSAAVSLTLDGDHYPTLGIEVPVGKSANFDVYFFSDDPLAPWTLYLDDSSSAFGGKELLDFSPKYVMGKNGDVVSVKVTAVAAGPYGGTEMLLTSYKTGDEKTLNYWFGFVEN
jgi:hypothetical protein